MSGKVPVAVVGVSWRSAPAAVRAQLAAITDETDPVQELRKGGYVTGAVRVATCSRTEWILTSDEPDWAATLLRGALMSRVAGLEQEQLHVRAGGASVHYLLRVAVGLDSVAEGEGAVGRQVLKHFEHARSLGLADKRIMQVWKEVERLINSRREISPGANARGVQSLVREELRERGARKVAILGRGDFGLAMERSLRGVDTLEISVWSRQTLYELLEKSASFDAIVICTGASEAWLQLPARRSKGLCIDAGSPPQVKSAPGWIQIGLDQLLVRSDMELPGAERERLEKIVMSATQHLTTQLCGASHSPVLAAIDAERTAFLNDQLPALLEGLPRDQVRKVRQAVGAFTHAILQKTREVSS